MSRTNGAIGAAARAVGGWLYYFLSFAALFPVVSVIFAGYVAVGVYRRVKGLIVRRSRRASV